jgi:hypothetical protein
LATSFAACAFLPCMVHIKFTTHPRTLIVSPKFGSMALEEALKASVEHKETSTEQLEESQGSQQAVISTEAASEQGAGSDQENQSEGSDNEETASDNDGHVKIGLRMLLLTSTTILGSRRLLRPLLCLWRVSLIIFQKDMVERLVQSPFQILMKMKRWCSNISLLLVSVCLHTQSFWIFCACSGSNCIN